MALVVFESRVNMLTVATPSVGGYVIAYDSADGILKQKNDQGVITPIAGSSSPGSLAQTLAIGNSSGTYSINLGSNCKIGSVMGGGQLRLDNSIGGINIVNLSTDYGALAQSYLYMSSNSLTLKSLNASLSLSSSSATFQLNSSNVFSFRTNNASITLNGLRVIDFTTATSSTTAGNRISALISTNNSKLNAGVYNTVVLGGYDITGATSNSVYVPNLYVKGFIQGIGSSGKLTFNTDDEAYLTTNVASNDVIIGMLNPGATILSSHNGIFITDGSNVITTNPITLNTFISTSNTTVEESVTNAVIIGGDGLYVTQSNTTYIGGSVSIGNSYILPSTDGVSGQVIKTDGSGNTYWGPLNGSLVEITAASFSVLNGVFESGTTYKILDADSSLYGGTEIYLTTNASGVLNETGVGKFYNPKYDQMIPGFGIWSATTLYSIDSIVFWGGKAWINYSGDNTAAPNQFSLYHDDWLDIAYDDPFTQFYYNVVYDEIKYDWQNDLIIYRNEKNTNIVSANKSIIDHLITGSFYNPIKVFQWGNVYDRTTGYGIGQQNIINSYNENINFAGSYQIDVRFTNYSKQYNCLFINGSSQETIVFDNSTQYDSDFDSSGQANIVISNQSYQNNLTFVDSSQQHIILDNNSWQDGIVLNNSSQIYLNFDDNSYQTTIYLDNGSEQTHIIFSDNSYQDNLTETTGLVQHSVRLENYSWNRASTPMTSNEEDLTLTGSKLSYQTPFAQTDKGIGEVVFFGTASTLDPGYIYQFTAGEWQKADLISGASASGLLGIALGEYVSDGLLLRGYATFDLSPYGAMTLGSILYLYNNGTFIQNATSTSGEIVRVVGYCVDEPVSGAGTLYFCPDTTWIEIA
jgi:hypothetical protein